MMARKVLTTMSKVLSFFCWLSVLLMWGSAASVYVNPALYGRFFGVLGLLFPIFAGAVLCMLVLCIVFWQKQAFICLFGLAACIGSVRDYCPVNLSSPPPKGCMKVMTYNVMGFNQGQKEDGQYLTLQYILDNRPDIVAMQEALSGEEANTEITETFRRYGYHYQLVKGQFTPLALASRYPIVHHELVCHTKSNAVSAFTLRPSSRDSLIVVCAHLQSMGLSHEDRGQFSELVHNPNEAESIHGKRLIVSKVATASSQRALMADTLAQYLDRHAGAPIVLMGDFNDTPISYAHHTICTRLTDAYRTTANGIGRSFNRDAIYVRIDNVFCSDHWKPFSCLVDNSVELSDHYPLIAFLKRLK